MVEEGIEDNEGKAHSTKTLDGGSIASAVHMWNEQGSPIMPIPAPAGSGSKHAPDGVIGVAPNSDALHCHQLK
jgi:hypothetical protein